MGLWGTLAIIPAAWTVYTLAQPGADSQPSLLTRLIAKYSDYQDTWAIRNDLHTRALEQAAADALLFSSSKPSPYVEHRMPE